MFEIQHFQLKSTKSWFAQRDSIDMEPEYQRQGGIWRLKDKQFLLDSIINDYDVPKLYLADFSTFKSSLNVERKRFAVIDGKQRLETLFEFLENEYPLAPTFEYLANPSLQLQSLYYKDLSQNHAAIAAKIEDYPLPIVHVVTDDLNRINELFVRLNKGASLTGAEKRNAMIGAMPKLIRRVSEHEFFKTRIRYNVRRGQNLNAAAKVILFEIKGDLQDTKRVALDKMVDEFRELNQTKAEKIRKEVGKTLDRMASVFGNKDSLLASEGNIPVYYWLVRNTRRITGTIRARLEAFNRKVAEARANDFEGASKDVIEYDLALRSINDEGSHRKRYGILMKNV